MESTIKELIKRNQSKLQFGFTKNVDYRACSILRETAVSSYTAWDNTETPTL